MDIGLEAAGWRTVSFSEIDPFASAVLAEHWPDVPNLGDITTLAGPLVRDERTEDVRRDGLPPGEPVGDGDSHRGGVRAADGDWTEATLWSGGFPCTDLSLAGKRAGLRDADGNLTRSGLAFAFLDLVGRYRPYCILLENVYGLLSSNGGRDLGALIRAMAELGYVGSYRGLDAQWFGVPQRRKRLFILAFDVERHPDPDGASTVLALSTLCPRGHKSEREAFAQAPRGSGDSALGSLYNATAAYAAWRGPDDWAGTLSTRDYKSSNHLVVDRAPADPGGVRAPSGMAGWVDGGALVASALDGAQGGADGNDARGGRIVTGHFATADDPLLPVGQDSHRYRAIGNGVAAPVAHWIGLRLRQYLEGTL